MERVTSAAPSSSNSESRADKPLPDAGTDVLGPALAAQAARGPRWPEVLAQTRWTLRTGERKRRTEGTMEDGVDPETRTELERRCRLRLAVYDATDVVVACEGRVRCGGGTGSG